MRPMAIILAAAVMIGGIIVLNGSIKTRAAAPPVVVPQGRTDIGLAALGTIDATMKTLTSKMDYDVAANLRIAAALERANQIKAMEIDYMMFLKCHDALDEGRAVLWKSLDCNTRTGIPMVAEQQPAQPDPSF